MAEILAANQITIAKVLDGEKGEMSAEQLAQLNQASEDASQAKSDVANLEIGGRNLILKSETRFISKYKDEITNQTGITVSEWGTNNAIRSYGVCSNSTIFGTLATGSSSPISALGQAYVHSIYVKNNGETAISISNNGIGGSRIIQAGESTRVIIYGTGNGSQYLQLNFYGSNLGDAFDVTYWHPKIEIGNKATDWTPAPEDVDAGIANAAKVATNFINYDSTNGLILGNKESGSWVGYRTQIDTDSFNVLNENGNIIASYGSNVVELGKGNPSAIIKMCDGKAYVKNYIIGSQNTSVFCGQDVTVVGEWEGASEAYALFKQGFINIGQASSHIKLSNENGNMNQVEIQGQNITINGELALGTALSIANGGTGETTVAGARNALGLGNTSGAVPIANGGTGATSLAAAQENLGIKANSERIDNLILGTGTSPVEVQDARLSSNGTQYTTLKSRLDAENSELKSDLSDLTDDTTNILSINIFDKRLVSLGGFVANTNGEFTPSSNYFATDYIPVTAGQYRRKNFNNWYCCFYDTNKNFVEQIPYETDTMTFTESGFIRLSGTTANIDICMVWKGSDSIATYVPYIRSPHYIPSPMDFGAKGDGVTVDNVALNAYFKYCYDYGLDADGFGRTYLVDDSTETFTDAETSSVHYGVKAYGARKIQNFNFVLVDGVRPLTPCLTVIISDAGVTRVENCSFRGGTSTNTGVEDGGNHGILFVKDRMFPAYWQELSNVYVDNCTFSRIWSYGIFLTPINAVFRVSNCHFGCGGPAILTYATKSFINNCVYGWTGREGQIDTLCIDEIENFNNVSTPYKKNIYISNCKSSRQIHHISEQVQRSVSYGNVVIDKCYSDDKIFQTYDVDTETGPTIVIDNLVIRDSFCGLLSGNSRIITLDHLDGNAVFDNFSYSDNGYSGWVINKSKGSIYLKETKTPTLLDITYSEIEFLSPNYSTINV